MGCCVFPDQVAWRGWTLAGLDLCLLFFFFAGTGERNHEGVAGWSRVQNPDAQPLRGRGVLCAQDWALPRQCAAWQTLRSPGSRSPNLPSPWLETGPPGVGAAPGWPLSSGLGANCTAVGILYARRKHDVTSASVKCPPGVLLSGSLGSFSALAGPEPLLRRDLLVTTMAAGCGPGKDIPGPGVCAQGSRLPGLLLSVWEPVCGVFWNIFLRQLQRWDQGSPGFQDHHGPGYWATPKAGPTAQTDGSQGRWATGAVVSPMARPSEGPWWYTPPFTPPTSGMASLCRPWVEVVAGCGWPAQSGWRACLGG